ncbi:hypothetical protein C0J52_04147 [Blattella germanica]|nr:hypothetical protein C0J52_04147 [Blattella germanica]
MLVCDLRALIDLSLVTDGVNLIVAEIDTLTIGWLTAAAVARAGWPPKNGRNSPASCWLESLGPVSRAIRSYPMQSIQQSLVSVLLLHR